MSVYQHCTFKNHKKPLHYCEKKWIRKNWKQHLSLIFFSEKRLFKLLKQLQLVYYRCKIGPKIKHTKTSYIPSSTKHQTEGKILMGQGTRDETYKLTSWNVLSPFGSWMMRTFPILRLRRRELLLFPIIRPPPPDSDREPWRLRTPCLYSSCCRSCARLEKACSQKLHLYLSAMYWYSRVPSACA